MRFAVLLSLLVPLLAKALKSDRGISMICANLPKLNGSIRKPHRMVLDGYRSKKSHGEYGTYGVCQP